MAQSLFPLHLDPSTHGPDDCQKCKTRRIRCDRGRPFCGKCSHRGFQCPGYPCGVILRWGQGVASRGRLKGQSVPVREENSSPSTQAAEPSLPLENEERNTPTPPMKPNPIMPPCAIPRTALSQENILFPGPSPPVHALLQAHAAQRLLHHYSQMISSRLPWIDSVDNPWRTVILPLAMESPALLFAMLSMAAEDLAIHFDNASLPSDFSGQARDYSERAVKLLTEHFAKEFALDTVKSLDSKSTTHALAATLVLCNLEIRQPRSTSWRIHLRAAQTVIRCCTTTNDLPDANSAANAFLIQKFFSMNVFAFISTFGDTDEMLGGTFTGDCNSIFIEFLRIMQTITQEERRQRHEHNSVHTSQVVSSTTGCEDIRRRFDHARAGSFVCSEYVKLDSADDRRDLESVVNMFYYAGLIYSHRAVLIKCCAEQLERWRDAILEHFNAMRNVGRFSQDLLWPLFIAGTEVLARRDLQEVLEREIRGVIELSGHWNGLEVLRFLRDLWEASVEGPVGWIDLARDWNERGNGFLII